MPYHWYGTINGKRVGGSCLNLRRERKKGITVNNEHAHPTQSNLQKSQAQLFRIVGLDDGAGDVTEGPRLPGSVEGQVDGFRVQGDQAGAHGVEGIESKRGGPFLPEAG